MSKLIFLKDLENIDYRKYGFLCGIEVHQQLDTKKLFCNCPCKIVDNSLLNKQIKRKLRFSVSETGDIDSAALEEFKKQKANVYRYNDECACLVDLDEQPPEKLNEDALSVAIRTGIMMNINFFDRMQFMRKLIIDGSVTSGFQRTAMLGIDGYINTSFGKVGINGINLEEDSSRTIERLDDCNVYALDRQGIPLIEITTAPHIKTSCDALEVAEILGSILRSFKEVKRGLGTIRQDLNVSITNGARVEIKGIQNLKMIPKIIDSEIRRQIIILSIIDELKTKGINCDNFSDFKIYDITDVFANTESNIIKKQLQSKQARVLAIILKKFTNILGHELNDNYRFATEISNRNKKHFPSVKGIFHSDELPKYEISEKEVEDTRKLLKIDKQDAFIIITAEKEVAEKSLLNVFEIIKNMITKVNEEVRQVDPKGVVTTYLRAMPGSARMYPETDVLRFEISDDYLNDQKQKIPEEYTVRLLRLSKEWEIEEINKIEEILDSFSEQDFEYLSNILNSFKKTYTYLFEIPKEVVKRESLEPIMLSVNTYAEILKNINNSTINKNTLYELYKLLFKENKKDVLNFSDYIKNNNLVLACDLEDIDKDLKEIIAKNSGAPLGALMGIAMKHFNNKVDGAIISKKLKELMLN